MHKGKNVPPFVSFPEASLKRQRSPRQKEVYLFLNLHDETGVDTHKMIVDSSC